MLPKSGTLASMSVFIIYFCRDFRSVAALSEGVSDTCIPWCLKALIHWVMHCCRAVTHNVTAVLCLPAFGSICCVILKKNESWFLLVWLHILHYFFQLQLNCIFYLKPFLVNNLDLEIPKHFVKFYCWKRTVLKNAWFKIFSLQIKFCF